MSGILNIVKTGTTVHKDTSPVSILLGEGDLITCIRMLSGTAGTYSIDCGEIRIVDNRFIPSDGALLAYDGQKPHIDDENVLEGAIPTFRFVFSPMFVRLRGTGEFTIAIDYAYMSTAERDQRMNDPKVLRFKIAGKRLYTVCGMVLKERVVEYE